MNGGRYLREQIHSIESQTYPNWFICASDDGSTDDTVDILGGFHDRIVGEKLAIIAGPSKGFVANFLSLTCSDQIHANYYAYADQDDIWEPEKLSRALEWFRSVEADTPALYCSRTLYVDEDNHKLGLSPLFTKPPSFANALVQNIVGGNTIVFNQAAKRLICLAGPQTKVVTHDWWAYLVISGCGGLIHYDAFPSVRYRQHRNNLIGGNSKNSRWFIRIKMLINGYFIRWNAMHITALNAIKDHLTNDSQRRLHSFSMARRGGLIARWRAIRDSGVYRQTLLGNLGIIFAVLLKRL